MQPQDSPFPCYWWGTGLEDAGLPDARPDIGTYARYSFHQLPPLPFEMKGTFDWLASQPVQAKNDIGRPAANANAKTLPILRDAAHALGLQLPDTFIKFMETPSLHQRIRSNTDCFLDLDKQPLPSPFGDGYLIRFLSDSQGCVFWYLYLTKDSADHAVVSTPDFYYPDANPEEDDSLDPSRIVFVAESIEAFICRYWLENEIWYAEYEKKPMPKVGEEYIERYRSK